MSKAERRSGPPAAPAGAPADPVAGTAPDPDVAPGDRPAPWTEHLEELRRRIIWSLVAVAVGTAVGLALVPRLLHFLIAQAERVVAAVGGQVVLLGIGEIMGLWIRLGVWIGVILAAPVILYQAVAFVLPALLPAERRLLYTLLPATLGLFGMGAAFGYLALIPATLRFMVIAARLFGVPVLLTPRQYVDLIVAICLPLGICFELPVLVWILASLGLVTAGFLRRFRRYAVLLILILAAFLTPGAYVVDQLLMAMPLLGLYEVSIWVAAVAERRRTRAAG